MQSFDPMMPPAPSALNSVLAQGPIPRFYSPFPLKFMPAPTGSLEMERSLVKRKRAPTAVVKSLSLEDLRPHFSKPLQEAAAILGISANSLKRTARRLGIPRWPYRGLKGLVRSKKEVIRGMSTCGNESDKRDILRKQYCTLASKEAQLRTKGALVDENDEDSHYSTEDVLTQSVCPEDGLDALAEAAQAHSVSADDNSGEDESQEQTINKKQRTLPPGYPPRPEDCFVRPVYPMPQQRPMSHAHPQVLENMIQQLLYEQQQLVSRISHLESNMTTPTPQHASTLAPNRIVPASLPQKQMPAPSGQDQLLQTDHSARRQLQSPLFVPQYGHVPSNPKMGLVDRNLFYSMPAHVS